MRKINVAVALLAMAGWAASAHASSVSQTYDVDDAYGASGTTVLPDSLANFTAATVSGTLMGTVSTPNSTGFTGSVPPVSAYLHLGGGSIQAKGSRVDPFGGDWTVKGTVTIVPMGSTRCHVDTHTTMSGGRVAASCYAGFSVMTNVHCSATGNGCTADFLVPGCWTGASDSHTQTWTTGSIHLGAATFTHTQASAHYLKSFNATVTPPLGHLCGSTTTQPHLASSDRGYHTFHVGAKQR